MFTFNISIFIFTVLIFLAAVYFKIYRIAGVVGVTYILFAVITFYSSESEVKPEQIETLKVVVQPDSITEELDTIFSITDTTRDSVESISVDTVDIQFENAFVHNLEVRSIKISRGILVEQRKPVGVDTVFTLHEAETLICFTGIRNTGSDIQTVTHIWEYNHKIKARIAMEVSPSPFWRCWSRKRIRENQKGKWKVKIVNEVGMAMGEKVFFVK